MRDNFDRDELREDFEERVEKFEEYLNDPEQKHKIFTELGFTYVDDCCDGYCPKCEQKNTCNVYPDIKEEWDNALQNQN